MRKSGMVAGAILLVSGALGAWLLMRSPYVSGQSNPGASAVFGPIPCQGQPADIPGITLAPVEKLGKALFFDCTLSDPPDTLAGPKGYACGTCHVLQTGLTGPNSQINFSLGPQPGVIPGRFGSRKVQTIAYTAFSPSGPIFNSIAKIYIGGNFWDGRSPDLFAQAREPFITPNEMANTPSNGSNYYPPVAGGYSNLVAQKVISNVTKYGAQLDAIYGKNKVQTLPSPQLQYTVVCNAIAAYEASGEVNPFSSKYDASKFGVQTPPNPTYTLSASEERGRQLFFHVQNLTPGNNPNEATKGAACFICHSSVGLAALGVSIPTNGKDTFTLYGYANTGVPKNPNNPFYAETNSNSNPHGYNPLGANFIDLGLAGNPNVAAVFNNSAVRGMFKFPTVRNVDLRPYPSFVKAYMHNGVFKSLKECVHFYNKRNVARNAAGQEVPFDLTVGPPAGYTPLFPPPEVLFYSQGPPLSNVVNFQGNRYGDFPPTGPLAIPIGNIGLTDQDEDDLVNFLKILSDGYTTPNPVTNPALTQALTLPSSP